MAFFSRASAIVGITSAAAFGSIVKTPSLMHCQVPCGIFDDPARIAILEEHAKLIRKAQVQIKELSLKTGDALSTNQSVRWVIAKEDAAKDIIEIVANYMLAQRVKKTAFATEHDYLDALAFHHSVMQSAMKAKQNVSTESADVSHNSLMNNIILESRSNE